MAYGGKNPKVVQINVDTSSFATKTDLTSKADTTSVTQALTAKADQTSLDTVTTQLADIPKQLNYAISSNSINNGSSFERKPMACLTFDDGYDTDFTLLKPVMDSYNVKGTLYIISNLVGQSGRLSVDQIKQHRIVEFLDNNFLAYDKYEDILEELIEKKIRCNFNQGLDIRLVNERNAELLSKLNYENEYIFAFDSIKYKPLIEEKFEIVKKYISKSWKVKMFVLVGWDSSLAEDIERVEWCRQHNVLPYLMRHEKCWSSENRDFYIDFASF
jgi:hypothetical protein